LAGLTAAASSAFQHAPPVNWRGMSTDAPSTSASADAMPWSTGVANNTSSSSQRQVSKTSGCMNTAWLPRHAQHSTSQSSYVRSIGSPSALAVARMNPCCRVPGWHGCKAAEACNKSACNPACEVCGRQDTVCPTCTPAGRAKPPCVAARHVCSQLPVSC
jgi:hypothetical protein